MALLDLRDRLDDELDEIRSLAMPLPRPGRAGTRWSSGAAAGALEAMTILRWCAHDVPPGDSLESPNAGAGMMQRRPPWIGGGLSPLHEWTGRTAKDRRRCNDQHGPTSDRLRFLGGSARADRAIQIPLAAPAPAATATMNANGSRRRSRLALVTASAASASAHSIMERRHDGDAGGARNASMASNTSRTPRRRTVTVAVESPRRRPPSLGAAINPTPAPTRARA